jgi:hypothetical protein
MYVILLMRKEIIINIWPNRDNNDHILIITIDVDSQADERSASAFLFDPSKNHEALDLYLSRSWTVVLI